MNGTFQEKLDQLLQRYKALINRPNEPDPAWYNGLFQRYQYPVLTAAHTPPFWRYDLNPETNPHLIERMGINAVFNPGAIDLRR